MVITQWINVKNYSRVEYIIHILKKYNICNMTAWFHVQGIFENTFFPKIEIMVMYLVFCFDQINLTQDNVIHVYPYWNMQMVSMCNIVIN